MDGTAKARREEARRAVTEALEAYRDATGPVCWCGGPGDEGEEHADAPGTCPSIPPTVSLTAWVLVSEWADLNPDGWVGTSYLASTTCSPNTVRGMLDRAKGNY